MVLSDQCCLYKLPSYERGLRVRFTFHSNSNVIKIDEEMSSKPSELLETKEPNTNLFNSGLLWSLASAFGL